MARALRGFSYGLGAVRLEKLACVLLNFHCEHCCFLRIYLVLVKAPCGCTPRPRNRDQWTSFYPA
jgi:hypothetical protein